MKIILKILILTIMSTGNILAHEGEHKSLVCISDSERTAAQRQAAKSMKFMHRLSKLDQDCLILKVEELERDIKILEDKLNQ